MLTFKGKRQLAHKGIRYHFIANLHITGTRSILFSDYDKTISQDEQKHTHKNEFCSKLFRIKQNTVKIEADF